MGVALDMDCDAEFVEKTGKPEIAGQRGLSEYNPGGSRSSRSDFLWRVGVPTSARADPLLDPTF